MREGRVVSACPEVLAGLGTPRPPSEIVQVRGATRVLTRIGRDVTAQFERGAALALDQALASGVRVAVLKEGSPSCASAWIYDGTFTGTRVAGEGVTTALLRSRGIRVFSETEIEAADALIARLERP